MRQYVIILILFAVQQCSWVQEVKASDADLQWQDAVETAKQGESDFAFMDFYSIPQLYANSRYAPDALFAMGEYYYAQSNLPMAVNEFKELADKYPSSIPSLIALLYLYKLSQPQPQQDTTKTYQERIASFRQVVFIFKERKVINYLSGFQHKYKLVYTINKVELYADGHLFTQADF